MATRQVKERRQKREGRLEIVAQLYRRGYCVRQIRAEVMKRLDLATYSVSTCHKDIQHLLAEWRESRVEDMDLALQLELERIDDTCRELWSQWEKSKLDYQRVATTRKGAPKKNTGEGNNNGGIETMQIEESKTNIQALGNPAYISEIRQQLAERRKLLGLYAPEKKEVKGSFATFLEESGLIE